MARLARDTDGWVVEIGRITILLTLPGSTIAFPIQLLDHPECRRWEMAIKDRFLKANPGANNEF